MKRITILLVLLFLTLNMTAQRTKVFGISCNKQFKEISMEKLQAYYKSILDYKYRIRLIETTIFIDIDMETSEQLYFLWTNADVDDDNTSIYTRLYPIGDKLVMNKNGEHVIQNCCCFSTAMMLKYSCKVVPQSSGCKCSNAPQGECTKEVYSTNLEFFCN